MAGVLEKTVFAVSPKHSRAGRTESSIAFVAYTACQEFLAKVTAEYAVFRWVFLPDRGERQASIRMKNAKKNQKYSFSAGCGPKSYNMF